MRRRLGPLPVWGWVVVAIAAYLYWRRRTEGGWFPGASYPVSLGGGGGGGLRSFLGMGGRAPESEGYGEGEGVSFLGGGGTRPTLPSPITAGGPDGSTDGGSFATLAEGVTLSPAGVPSRQAASTTTVYGSVGPAPTGQYSTGLQGTLGGSAARTIRRTFGRR